MDRMQTNNAFPALGLGALGTVLLVGGVWAVSTAAEIYVLMPGVVKLWVLTFIFFGWSFIVYDNMNMADREALAQEKAEQLAATMLTSKSDMRDIVCPCGNPNCEREEMPA